MQTVSLFQGKFRSNDFRRYFCNKGDRHPKGFLEKTISHKTFMDNFTYFIGNIPF